MDWLKREGKKGSSSSVSIRLKANSTKPNVVYGQNIRSILECLIRSVCFLDSKAHMFSFWFKFSSTVKDMSGRIDQSYNPECTFSELDVWKEEMSQHTVVEKRVVYFTALFCRFDIKCFSNSSVIFKLSSVPILWSLKHIFVMISK